MPRNPGTTDKEDVRRLLDSIPEPVLVRDPRQSERIPVQCLDMVDLT